MTDRKKQPKKHMRRNTIRQIELCDDYRITEAGTWRHEEYTYWIPDNFEDPDSHLQCYVDTTSHTLREVTDKIKVKYPGIKFKTRTRHLREPDIEEDERTLKNAKGELIKVMNNVVTDLLYKGYNSKQIKTLLKEFYV